MRRSILPLIAPLILFTSHVRADLRRLTPFEKLPQKERADLSIAATSSFDFKLEPGISCTGTFISEKGHFLTALHCIAACLEKNRALWRSRASDEPVTLAGGRKAFTKLVTVDDDRIDAGLECPGLFRAHSFGEKRLKARVIMTGGKGWLTPKESVASFQKSYPDEYKKLLDDGYEHAYDFAVLKVDLPSQASCLEAAADAPAVGEEVRAIPYACVERDNLRADGQLALFTSGARTSGFKASDYFKSRAPAGLPFDPSPLDRKEVFFSDLDLEKCGSGTGLFDGKKRLVGVATRVYKSSSDYEYGSLEAISIAQIRRQLASKLSGSEVQEILACRPPPTKGQTRKR